LRASPRHHRYAVLYRNPIRSALKRSRRLRARIFPDTKQRPGQRGHTRISSIFGSTQPVLQQQRSNAGSSDAAYRKHARNSPCALPFAFYVVLLGHHTGRCRRLRSRRAEKRVLVGNGCGTTFKPKRATAGTKRFGPPIRPAACTRLSGEDCAARTSRASVKRPSLSPSSAAVKPPITPAVFGPPFTATASTDRRRDGGLAQRARGLQEAVAEAPPVDPADFNIAPERVVLQAVVSDESRLIGCCARSARQACTRSGATHTGAAAAPGEQHRLVSRRGLRFDSRSRGAVVAAP